MRKRLVKGLSAVAVLWLIDGCRKQSLINMLVEEDKTRRLLQQIVVGFTRHSHLQQDLMQECLLHLWKLEGEIPRRTRSWYLQGCRFHLQHCLSSGRSVDSLKRAHSGNPIDIGEDEENSGLTEHHTNGELFEAVSFADVLSTLERKLGPRERQVLSGLADGMAPQEIASKFGMSYPTVLKYRRKLAEQIIRLGIGQPLAARKRNDGTDPGSVNGFAQTE